MFSIKKLNLLKLFLFKPFSVATAPVENQSEKIINVAIIGVPNAGKSTLINNLIERKICPASSKVHTTKNLSRAICVSGNTQIVFLDTPGVVTDREIKKYNLKKPMHEARLSLPKADIIGAIHDVSNAKTRDTLHRTVRDMLIAYRHIPSFLILNKIDLIKSKSKLLDVVRLLSNNVMAGKPIIRKQKPLNEASQGRGFDGFSDVFMISALELDGLDAIKKYLIENAQPGKWTYTKKDWTDQPAQVLIEEVVRAKLLDFLPHEIPYSLISQLEYLEETDEKLVCAVSVTCPSERIEKLINGIGGGRLKEISDSCRFDLLNMFQKHVALTLSLKSPKINKK